MTSTIKHLTLFVTGDAPRSRRARSNLAEAMQRAGGDMTSIQEIDLLKHHEVALKHGIFATPALMLQGQDSEPHVMYGDLSDTRRLETFLASTVPRERSATATADLASQ